MPPAQCAFRGLQRVARPAAPALDAAPCLSSPLWSKLGCDLAMPSWSVLVPLAEMGSLRGSLQSSPNTMLLSGHMTLAFCS